jgi:hypothetical protein
VGYHPAMSDTSKPRKASKSGGSARSTKKAAKTPELVKAYGPAGTRLMQGPNGTWKDPVTGEVVDNPTDFEGNPLS